MRLEMVQFDFLPPITECSFSELAELSALTAAELSDLIDCGAVAPIDAGLLHQRFTASAVRRARTAARLRDEFELEISAVALALLLLERVHELEAQLQHLRVQLPAACDTELRQSVR